MSSEELSLRDTESFKFYRQNLNELESSEKKILSATVRNEVDVIKSLLNSPKLYKITDKHGLNLLHIAILQNSKEAFNYIVSLPDFPLEMISDYGETALITAILVIDLDNNGRMKSGDDYFAFELIKRGADIFYCDNFGYSTLSCAALKHHIKMAEMFIENGVELDLQDVYGNTALHQALDHESPDCFEFVSFLLFKGADPRVKNEDELIPFEKAVLHCRDSLLQEVLFNYTYDCYSEMKTQLNVLLRLAQYESVLINFFEDADVGVFSRGSYTQLFYVEAEFLKILLKKFQKAIGIILAKCTLCEWSRNAVTFEKIEIFLHSEVKREMITCIQNENDDLLLQHLIENEFDGNNISTIMCYLLSFGLNLKENSLQIVYKKFGNCELFRIFLHMDIKKIDCDEKQIMASLLYDVGLTLDDYLGNCDRFSEENVDRLLCYFANAKLKKLCYELYDDDVEIVCKIQKLPQVPLLVELARNVFRRYFIERFYIKNSRKFYTVLMDLNISNVYKQIIAYEKRLY